MPATPFAEIPSAAREATRAGRRLRFVKYSPTTCDMDSKLLSNVATQAFESLCGGVGTGSPQAAGEATNSRKNDYALGTGPRIGDGSKGETASTTDREH